MVTIVPGSQVRPGTNDQVEADSLRIQAAPQIEALAAHAVAVNVPRRRSSGEAESINRGIAQSSFKIQQAIAETEPRREQFRSRPAFRRAKKSWRFVAKGLSAAACLLSRLRAMISYTVQVRENLFVVLCQPCTKCLSCRW